MRGLGTIPISTDLMKMQDQLSFESPLQFKEVFLTEKYLAIAMEYADGGDMFQHVRKRQGLHEHEV